jgi:hypothetical protein
MDADVDINSALEIIRENIKYLSRREFELL